MVAQGEGRVATLNSCCYLIKALLYLICCSPVPAHVMVDNQALASSQVRCQFIEEHIFRASVSMPLGANLKAVVRVHEDKVATGGCAQGTL
jgi:hypothetical protein